MNPSQNGEGPHESIEGPGNPKGLAALCGKRKRNGEPCRNQAGKKTNHLGTGPCWLHGGAVGKQMTHGRYSTIQRVRLRDLIEGYERDPDPLNMLPELAVARALFVDYVDRVKKGESGEAGGTDFDVGAARQLVSEVTQIVKRIEDGRAANAISRADFYRVVMELGRVVDVRVEDEDVRAQIHDDWLRIALP
jgi:hypothetical protein